MNTNDYIIDFDRVNQLTTSIYDDPNDKSEYRSDGKFAYSVSRKFIREYIDVFQSFSGSVRNTTIDKIEHIVNTLEYNGILIHKSTIRDKKINDILE
jgi:hypothetical protein